MSKNKRNKGGVLISGGAGFIGSHTADLCLKNGYQVTILDNLSSKTHSGNWPKYLDRRIKKIKGDVRSKSSWLKALKGVNYVIHLAAWMDMMPEFSKFFSINTVGTANLYEVIIKHNLPVKKIVIASSQFVYGQGRWKCKRHGQVYPKNRLEKNLQKGEWNPVCPKCKSKITPLANREDCQDPPNQYALSKYTQELLGLTLGKLYGLPTTALRYSIVHGSRQTLKSSYSGALRQFFLWLNDNQEVSVYEDGQQLRDYVSVHDVASANVTVMESEKSDFEVFNVGGGKNYTVISLAKMIGKVMGKKIFIKKSGFYRVGDTRHSFSSISKLKRLGWFPKKTEQESILDFISWAKTQNLSNISVNKSQKKLKDLDVLRKAKN
jgi:dTDP-L-rhamnose 4-epimerase